MKHTPYGYDIINGRAVVNEEQAAVVRKVCSNYLSGMTLVAAAADAGLTMKHSGVKMMMLNKRYLGNDFYPAILDKNTVKKIRDELERRQKTMGRKGRKRKGTPKRVFYTGFSAPRIAMKYKDPVKQAEYAYSRIRNEVKG